MFTKEEIALAKPVYDALLKLGWNEGPNKGEWCLMNRGLYLVAKTYPTGVELFDYGFASRRTHPNLIPLLHWEKIEEILEGMGYYMSLPTKGERSDLWVVGFSSFKFKGIDKEFRYYKNTYVGRGKTRQEAVMQAVIKLAEEVNQ